eukprot:TRINITY_DN4329_c1_g1_i1.p1 TRINITY_DN4329_c1_g1~~TRINITY_DN4329_c1_g1_i1.p1  ORF type:complete len:230 (+),score=36.93 TRINITY_DN4329_c1_g1_i1:294-983(+)
MATIGCELQQIGHSHSEPIRNAACDAQVTGDPKFDARTSLTVAAWRYTDQPLEDAILRLCEDQTLVRTQRKSNPEWNDKLCAVGSGLSYLHAELRRREGFQDKLREVGAVLKETSLASSANLAADPHDGTIMELDEIRRRAHLADCFSAMQYQGAKTSMNLYIDCTVPDAATKLQNFVASLSARQRSLCHFSFKLRAKRLSGRKETTEDNSNQQSKRRKHHDSDIDEDI